ncbi:MAG: MBL fold metallo-hydrolase [Clostridiales bacterium]|nr:MBL fold metallo-hydrolase [Clostridiales bacterium]
MKIQWLGHSAFRLTDSTGASIITDPFDRSVGYDMPCLCADAIASSHGHGDHNFFQGVKGNPVIIDRAGSFNVGGISVRSFLSDHDPVGGKLRGKNLIFNFRLDGVSVCHMGDIGEACTREIIEPLIPVNILLIPVGGTYTIDAGEAKEYVDRMKPDVVIPMHYKTEHTAYPIDKVDAFLRLFDSDAIAEEDTDTLEFNASDFNGKKTKIIVPKRYLG